MNKIYFLSYWLYSRCDIGVVLLCNDSNVFRRIGYFLGAIYSTLLLAYFNWVGGIYKWLTIEMSPKKCILFQKQHVCQIRFISIPPCSTNDCVYSLLPIHCRFLFVRQWPFYSLYLMRTLLLYKSI